MKTKRIVPIFSAIVLVGLIFTGCTSTPASPKAVGRSVIYESEGMKFEGYFISPSPNAPLVFLIHDWDGLTEYEQKRAQMLSELGYAVFAADLYGAGVRPTAVEDKRKKTGELYADREKMRSYMEAGLKAAASQGADLTNAAAMGYCFGGTAVLELARSGADLKAFVPFHGGLKTPEGQDYSKTNGQVVVFHGTADKAVSMDDFAELGKELEKHGVKHEMLTYSGAPHAFSVFGSPRYREDADKKSWKRFTEVLSEVLDK